MAKTRLHLKTRDEFAALSLHEKNDYLQGVAQQIAHVRAEEFSPLEKDSLSRIRRYYSYRSRSSSSGSAVLYLTCFSAKLERILATPRVLVSRPTMKFCKATVSGTTTRKR